MKQCLWERDQYFVRGSDADSQVRFEEAMTWTDKEIERSGGPFFFGEKFSLVDCAFISVVERAYATAFYYKGLQLWGRWPWVDAWLMAVGCRDSYRACCSDVHTHAHIHAGSLGRWGPCMSSRSIEAQEAQAAVDRDSHVACSYMQAGLYTGLSFRSNSEHQWK